MMEETFRWEPTVRGINEQCQSFMALINECFISSVSNRDFGISEQACAGAFMVLDLISKGMNEMTELADSRGVPSAGLGGDGESKPMQAGQRDRQAGGQTSTPGRPETRLLAVY